VSRQRSLDLRTVLASLLLAFPVVPFAGCSERKPANVLLISVDTLRPDRLGYGGNARPTSPAIDRLAGEGIAFPNAFSAAGWTLPSMATILSGRYPKDHRATSFRSALRDDLPTLSSILKRRGYDTRGYVSHLALSPQYGFDRGFDRFDDSVLDIGHPHLASTDRQLTDRVIADFGDIRAPYLLWVHYFGPHYDYLWHEGWESFGRSDSDRYDQEVAYTDSHIGRLLDELTRRGLYENTIVVFVADHGEEFGEHGGQYHYTLYNEVLRVPLIIRAPSLAPGSQSARVEQIDLLPTILGLLEAPTGPGETFAGRDVLAPAAPRGPTFFERDRPPPWRQRAVMDGRYKLVVIEEVASQSGPVDSATPVENVHPGIYLYDLEEDPGEQVNLYAEGDPRARDLLAVLEKHFAREAAIGPKLEIDEALREKLRSLGYAE